jgi:hypothetical protein
VAVTKRRDRSCDPGERWPRFALKIEKDAEVAGMFLPLHGRRTGKMMEAPRTPHPRGNGRVRYPTDDTELTREIALWFFHAGSLHSCKISLNAQLVGWDEDAAASFPVATCAAKLAGLLRPVAS